MPARPGFASFKYPIPFSAGFPTAMVVTLICAFLFSTTGTYAREGVVDAVDKNHFRVCADPNRMPYVNEKGEGFENRVATLFAEKLGIPLVYEWYAQTNTQRFIRETLAAKKCDVMMGINAANGLVQNTNPYYVADYVIIYRKDSGLDISRANDPVMADLKIGIVAGTPPGDLMAKYHLLSRVRPYNLHYVTEVGNIADTMMKDLKNGLIDVAFMMRPGAVYFAKKNDLDIEIVPLESTDYARGRLEFLITMGIRENELDWKRKLNALLKENRDEINAILQEYGVRTVKKRGRRRAADKAGDETDSGKTASP